MSGIIAKLQNLHTFNIVRLTIDGMVVSYLETIENFSRKYNSV